jgi:hypothetical protein
VHENPQPGSLQPQNSLQQVALAAAGMVVSVMAVHRRQLLWHAHRVLNEHAACETQHARSGHYSTSFILIIFMRWTSLPMQMDLSIYGHQGSQHQLSYPIQANSINKITVTSEWPVKT